MLISANFTSFFIQKASYVKIYTIIYTITHNLCLMIFLLEE